jgi:hypothetical protein
MTEQVKRRVAQQFERYRRGRVAHPDLDDVALFIELLLEWSPEEVDESAALLLYLVQFPVARDVVLVQWASGLSVGDSAWAFARGENPEWVQVVANVLVGAAPTPDPARLERGVAVVERLVALASEQYAAAPTFMLAWLTWARSQWPSP